MYKHQRQQDVGEMPDLIIKYLKIGISRANNFAFATCLAYTAFYELGGGVFSAQPNKEFI